MGAGVANIVDAEDLAGDMAVGVDLVVAVDWAKSHQAVSQVSVVDLVMKTWLTVEVWMGEEA